MKILIFVQWPVKAWSIPDTHATALYAAFPNVEFVRAMNLDEAARLIVDVDACFAARLTAEMVASASKLKWVHSPAAAVEGLLPLAALAERGIVVTNSKGVQAIPIAEHVMGGILMLSRKFNRTLKAQTEKQWIQNDLTADWPWLINKQHMTIVGLGTIGVEIAKRAAAFGVHVTGVRRSPQLPKLPFVDAVFGPNDLNKALVGCDMLVLSAPGVGSTHRMIGAEQIALLNRGALLVNVARAGIVDDAAMREALGNGQLRGAVLDVFEHEPLDATDGLWELPNVVLTPHSSGFRESHWDEVSALFSENLRRVQGGDELLNQVDLAAGY
ncbi:MAG: D-2-hydroxyacid dehydrogenase [Gemmatimonadaceae bacterium]